MVRSSSLATPFVFSYIGIFTFTVSLPVNTEYVLRVGSPEYAANWITGATPVLAGPYTLLLVLLLRYVTKNRLRPLFFLSSALNFVGILLYLFASPANSISLIVIGRILSSASISPFLSQMYINRAVPVAANRAKLQIFLATAITAAYLSGGVLGALITWLTRSWSNEFVNTTNASTWVLAMIQFMFFLPLCFLQEPDPETAATTDRIAAVKLQRIIGCLCLLFLSNLVFGIWDTNTVSVATSYWGWDINWASVYWGLLLCAPFPFVLCRVSKRLGSVNAVLLFSVLPVVGGAFSYGSTEHVNADITLYSFASFLLVFPIQLTRGVLWAMVHQLSDGVRIQTYAVAMSAIVYVMAVGTGVIIGGYISKRFVFSSIAMVLFLVNVIIFIYCYPPDQTALTRSITQKAPAQDAAPPRTRPKKVHLRSRS